MRGTVHWCSEQGRKGQPAGGTVHWCSERGRKGQPAGGYEARAQLVHAHQQTQQ